MYASNIAAACVAANALTRPQADLTDQQQKRRRLQMNRNNAQRNRDRKRIMIDMLQTEKTRLTTLNEKLQDKNKVINKHIDELKKNLESKSKQKKAHTPKSVAVPALTLHVQRPWKASIPQYSLPRRPVLSCIGKASSMHWRETFCYRSSSSRVGSIRPLAVGVLVSARLSSRLKNDFARMELEAKTVFFLDRGSKLMVFQS